MPLTAAHGLLAIAKASSGNRKIGDAATTYAAQASCPSSCAFFNGGGCYAENGTLFAIVTKPLNQAAEYSHADSLDVARAEADAIDGLSSEAIRNRPLRLHTVGDCRTDEAARIVSAAAERYMERGGGPVWTYTHAWQLVDRASWGAVSVLASCETAEQVELARARGYATAIVVEEFESPRLYTIGAGVTTGVSGRDERRAARPVLPCPAQTRDDVTCSICRLCMNDAGIRARGYSIGFAVHGTAFTIRQAVRALRAPSNTTRRMTSRDHALAFHEEHGRLPQPVELKRLADINSASAIEMVARLRSEMETPRVG